MSRARGRLPWGRLLRGRPVRAVVAAVTTAAVALAPGPAAAADAPPLPGGAGGEPVSELLTRMRDLYRRAETAGAAHRVTERELAERRGKVDRLQRELADTRVRLARARDEAGRLARQQYRGSSGVLPVSVRLLLGRDEREVREVLEHGRVLDRMSARRASAAARLSAEERRLDRLASRARDALDRQHTLAADSGRRREEAGRLLAEVERRLASLSDGELAALRRAEAAQHGW
ncbi:hypothetical protein [Streptomyces sp. DH37]|uniref:coiled-coil domain-containing protein n=1 Tax=Streptomyces sp. DH37 TaxID=3040122 RepID=UPI002442347D|nr:hypothetical protein [Streptomyces sp. DH37]MDG9702294.1 hypothetical protein [Streptomyces sp. DH37]